MMNDITSPWQRLRHTILDDNNIWEYISVEGNCMQLLLKRTHKSSDSEDEDNAKSRAEGQNVALGQGWVSTALLWHNMGTFSASQETFCHVCGKQVNTNTDDIFQKFSDLNLMHHIIQKTNKHAQQ